MPTMEIQNLELEFCKMRFNIGAAKKKQPHLVIPAV